MNWLTNIVIVACSLALAPMYAGALENHGYDKTNPLVLAVGEEYIGTTDSDRERKYFMAHVEPGAEYRIDLTRLSVDLDLYYKGSDATFLRDSLARSTNADDNDERILFTPKRDVAYFVLHNYDFKESDFNLLLTRSEEYLDEVRELSPIRLVGAVSHAGQVGTRSSLYEIGSLTTGATYRIAISGMQVDADLFVFSDPHYREELARSSKRYTEDEFVTVTTPHEVLYVEVRGRHRTSGTPFTLTVAGHDRLRDQGSQQEPMEIPVGEEVAAEVGGDRSYYFFPSTPGGHYTIKLLSPTSDADLYAHGDEADHGDHSHAHDEEDSGFAVVQDTSDNLRGEDEVLSVTAAGDRFYFSVDGSHTDGSGANYGLHVTEETFANEGEEQDPVPITGARYRGQVQAEGTSYYKLAVEPGKKYLIKATQEEVRGTWRFHFYVYDDGIHGRQLASAGYINGNEYKSALIESYTGEWLYLEVHSYDEDYGSHFDIDINEVRILYAG